ncbi:hypothetical protein GCM10017788_08290 [Amycolatopsis acidiphila]|nr:hypothetical protein GCM10017788_08290 [Amycolatopsis acidiphila]
MIISRQDVDERLGALSVAARWGNGAAATEAMAGAGPELWLAVDEAVRRWWKLPGGQRPAEIVLRALSRDGYIRETAIADTGRLDERLALPVLAIRAADWVPQVREAARRACLSHLARDPMAALTLLPIASRLRRRAHGEWLAATLGETLARTPEVLTAALVSPERLTRRAAYATGGLGPGRLKAGLRDADLPIRLSCAKALAGSEDPEVRQLLRTSGTAALRALAIRNRDDALAALTDRSSLVRAHAQLALRRGGEDPAVHYRKVPGADAVAGLGETGTDSDAPALLPFLGHERPGVRAETIRALRRLRCIPRTELVALLVADPAPRVARQAMLSLLGCAELIDERTLLDLLDGDRRHLAHRLLCARDTWTRVVVDLRLALDPAQPLRENALRDLRNWLTHQSARSYTSPGGTRAGELAQLVARAEPLLGARQVRHLRMFL